MPLIHLLNGIPLAAATNNGLPYVAAITSIAATGGTVDAVVTTTTPHLLAENQNVTVAGVTIATGLNATWPAKVLTPTTYALVGSLAVTGAPGGTPTYTIPTLDISTATMGANLMIQIVGDGVIEVQDSVDNFTTLVRRRIAIRRGDQSIMLNWADFQDFHRFGTASARLRVVCTSGSFSKVAVQFKT